MNEVPYERYLAVDYDNPRGAKEGAIGYIVRLAELAAEAQAGALRVKDVPSVRLPYADDRESA